MRIPLEPQHRTPLFRQIEAHLRRSIASGRLPAGTRLPSTRRLASDLGVNRLTVENAYAELEADGLIAGRAGSGTYVLAASPLPPLPPRDASAPWPRWQRELAGRRGATLGDPLGRTPAPARHRHLIRLDGGTGDPRLFPAEEFRKVIQGVMRREGASALGYGDPGGFFPLRRTIAHVLTAQGVPARPENVLVTAGSQRALALVSALLLRPGDAVVVERPTYAGALELFRAHGLRIVGVPIDAQGMRVEELETLLLQHHPRLIYTLPTFQNPTGACLSAPRRRQLLALAARHSVPILEDDYVGDLRYEGRAQPALKASDPQGHVIYVSTFSKMLMPGLRTGFLVAEGPVLDGLRQLQRVEELATCNLMQRALEAYITVGRYQAHLRRASRLYRRRRDAMLRAVERSLPSQVQVEAPAGGLFLWLRLPEGYSSAELLPVAEAAGVRIAPGGDFFPDAGDGARFLRLCFAAHEPEELLEGVRRLATALRSAEHPAPPAVGRRRGPGNERGAVEHGRAEQLPSLPPRA
ncbi:MAG: PLP-dependent aminotransferase family protein [Myxococcaceae bacterium]|nr:PLP-dependent aminotransferase family protein [Myxococcaceae bacterium]